MTDSAILEFKTAPVNVRIRAMQEIRNMSNKELADYVAMKTGKNVTPSDLVNILSGSTKGPAAEAKIKVIRELFNV